VELSLMDGAGAPASTPRRDRPTSPVHDLRFRRPDEADHGPIVHLLDEWWGGRAVRHLLPRLWFRHFAGSSWLAESASGRLAGLLVGFASPDRPDEACVVLVGTDPNLRRRGVGRALEERFFEDMAARGRRVVSAVVPAGDPVATGFHLALGYEPDRGPGTRTLWGMPAYPDYDDDGQDRIVFTRPIATAPVR
jgi:GNAT superfamily N-acetyltransferase